MINEKYRSDGIMDAWAGKRYNGKAGNCSVKWKEKKNGFGAT